MTAKMPDPVGFLHQCRKKPSNKALTWAKDQPHLKAKGYFTYGLITTTQAEAYAQAVRDEAEKLSRAKHYGNGHQDGWNSALEIVAKKASGKYLMPEFAKAIRALKGKP